MNAARAVLPSYTESVDVAVNSNSQDDTSFLGATTSPISLVENHGASQKVSEISLDAIFGQENCQPLLETGLKKNGNPRDIFDTADDIPETPKSVEIIDLVTPKKTAQNRSPLLPTQPLPTTCTSFMQRRPRTCCNGTLHNWINWSEPPPRREQVNANKYAPWLNIRPDVSPEKLDPVTKQTLSSMNAETTVSGSCLSHISSESLAGSTGIQLIFPNYNFGEFRKLTSNTRECPENQISGEITVLQNSSMILGPTLPVTSANQEETGEDQLDIISSIYNDFCLPLTPSPPKTLRKAETLKQVSLATMLNRSNVVDCYTVLESQHTRSLMKVISSPTFCRNDGKYVNNELTSRFDDDGKVRRKKAERRLLHGYDCPCCADYYEALGLNQHERNKRIDQVSKHRDIGREPSTPEYYWEVRMPNREEQRRRGQIIESTSPIALKTRYPEYKPNRRARRRLFI
ncbi:DNA repair protein endonuclease SAE2/CtIP C-terminus family protein [Brugia pahangi]|uniref:SAE2 domain-containing protein n=1 Tax=Brugia pahangi TaxID=6280 RepID=A0A0N4TQK2_BRUPA|nr:unnamed protein product [Brugia pahangi]